MKLSLQKIIAERKAMVLVCSDSISQGKAEDQAGAQVSARLLSMGLQVMPVVVLPDQVEAIQQAVHDYGSQVDLMLFVGGTGLSHRDVTPEAIRPLLTREIEGIMETARVYGQERMPFAMLSRGVAGMVNETLVITMPGSTKGAMETMDALFPSVMHVFAVKDGQKH
jgi:molybdenum cofactor synthesis domain-containing protein